MLCVGVGVGNGAISYRPRVLQEKMVKPSHFYLQSSIWKFLVFHLVLGKCRVLGRPYVNFPLNLYMLEKFCRLDPYWKLR